MLERQEEPPRDGSATEPQPIADWTTSQRLGLDEPRPAGVAERLLTLADRVDDLRDRPAIPAVIVVAAVALAFFLPRLLAGPPSGVPIEAQIPQVTLTPTSALAADAASPVIVHVSGAVRSPGVYSVSSTARVIDAVEAAGGANADADLDQLNLAAVVADGQQIHVPLPGEPPLTPTQAVDGPLDLNQADVVALQQLPGVGPATAEAIVAFRDDNGPFRTVDDLLDVPGIGPAKLAAIADAVVVR